MKKQLTAAGIVWTFASLWQTVDAAEAPTPTAQKGATTQSEALSAHMSLTEEVNQAAAWGTASGDGLQLGAWIPASHKRLVLCAIRNKGPKSISYNLCYVGYFEAVRLRARQKGDQTWTLIRRTPGKPRAFMSRGPRTFPVYELPPAHAISHIDILKRLMISRSGGVPIIEDKDSPFARAVAKLRELYPPRPQPTQPHSFAVDLTDFVWPEAWQGELEICIDQKLIVDEKRPAWEGNLSSGVVHFTLDRKMLANAKPPEVEVHVHKDGFTIVPAPGASPAH